jgi:diguanylate cyclase (GGDEF)-like protein
MFDADHFKLINDRYGHPAGDTVLCRLAALLTDTFRPVDVVARIGGEQFAVLLPSTDLPEAVALAERVRAQAEAEQVGLDGETIRFTVSAGVAAVDESLSGLDGLMKRADLALYAAKARGRNRVDSWTADCPSYKDHQRIRHDAD